MLSRIIIVAVILLVLLVVYLIFKPKDNALHRNMRPRTGKIIRIIIIIAIAVCAFFILKDAYSLSQNPGVFSEKTDTDTTSANQKISKDEVLVSISKDVVTINKKPFKNMDEIEKNLFEHISKGKSVIIVDNYALASTYEDVIDILTGMGVDRNSIKEIKEP